MIAEIDQKRFSLYNYDNIYEPNKNEKFNIHIKLMK